MATELVLLSEIEVDGMHVIRAAADLHPDGTWVSYNGGELGQLVDVESRPVLTVFRSRPVSHPRAAAAALKDPPTAFGLWTEVLVPYGAETAGREVADAVARQVGGVVKDRV
jgi:hypothetical protein